MVTTSRDPAASKVQAAWDLAPIMNAASDIDGGWR
jgi:hypothetical protein